MPKRMHSGAHTRARSRFQIHLHEAFTAGQAYVALSRCRTEAGLQIVNWRPGAIMASHKVVAFYAALNQKDDHR